MARNSKRREIWAADCETDPFKKGRIPVPFIWGAYNGEEYHQFETTEDFIAFIAMKNVVCYAHNGGKFDWHFVTNYIDDYEPLTIIAGRLAKFKIGECEFRDSFNIIPAKLADYKKDDFDYTILEADIRDIPTNRKKIEEYLKNDCVYLWEMIDQFVSEYGVHLTQASAAMTIWSKMSGTPKPQSSPYYYEDLSKFYYGGRVECFKTGIIEKPFSVVDIKSAYPRAMIDEHPWGMIYSSHDTIPDISEDELKRCFITLEARSLGAFPIRDKTGLRFPNDGELREFNITGHEYIAAKETGHLQDEKISFVREYLDSINFKPYVDHFFDKKQIAELNNDAGGRLFAKIFLNALYGKFASNPENYEEFMTIPANLIEGAISDGWNYCKLFNEDTAVVNQQLQEEKRRYYDVAVSASITGWVRAYLWKSICATNGSILYCDTDSIAAHDTSQINIGPNLGDWELEANCIEAAIAGKKLYAFKKENGEFKTASKGVRLEPHDIYDIARGETITYEPEAPTFSIKRGIIFTPRKIRMIENIY